MNGLEVIVAGGAAVRFENDQDYEFSPRVENGTLFVVRKWIGNTPHQTDDEFAAFAPGSWGSYRKI